MHSDHIFIETSRLLIKPPAFEDFDAICALNANSEVMRYIEICRPISKVRELMEKAILHYQKHGFSFGTVFEKSSGNLIGQAGILYLSYDETQPEIEIGYRLHPSYWNKGYAVELARALIEWGFNHLSVDKLIAVIHPENNRSRRVLERVGMYYVGKTEAYNTTVAKYQIERPFIELSEIKLIPATQDDYAIIQNMATYYIYDISEYFLNQPGWELENTGYFNPGMDFKKYGEEIDTHSFLIRYRDELVGFVIIDKKGTDRTIDFNMAQFFILRKFTGKGIGKYIVNLCFQQFKGVWEVRVIPGNESAYRFWRSVIAQFTHNQYEEYTKEIPHIHNEEIKFKRNFFKFKS